MNTNILHADPPPPWMGTKDQNLTCHAAYQIKENHKCSIMIANI